MRVTNSIVSQNAIRALLRNQEEMQASSRQIASGLRIERVSDAPGDASAVMGTSSEIRALAQYRRTIAATQATMQRQEGVLNSLTDVLTRAQELAITHAGSGSSAQGRATAKLELDQLLSHAVSLANTEHAGSFLFGGVQRTTAPATLVAGSVLDFTITNAGAAGPVEVSSGVRVQPADSASAVFGDATTGPLAALKALGQALANNDPAAISAAGTALGGATQRVQGVLTSTGARANQLESTQANLEALDTTLRVYQSQVRDVDIEKAMTALVARQTAYQAAMAATSRMLDLNLTTYLR